MSQNPSEDTTRIPGPDIEPAPTPDSNGDEAKEEAGEIWIVSNKRQTVLRARFYKSLLLTVSCVFQLVIAGEVLRIYGPFTFLAFALGVTTCAGIAAHEAGSLLSGVDMRVSALKDALWGHSQDEVDDPDAPEISRV